MSKAPLDKNYTFLEMKKVSKMSKAL